MTQPNIPFTSLFDPCENRVGPCENRIGPCENRIGPCEKSAYHRSCRNRSAVNWDLFCQARGTANRLYAAAKARYSADSHRNLDDCVSANDWWRTPEGHLFFTESDIPPLYSYGGALVSDPAGKAELLSAWFDSKQSRDIVELPQTCHRRPAFCGIAFRAREVERYLLDLDPNGGVDPSGCSPMFFRGLDCFCSCPKTESSFS